MISTRHIRKDWPEWCDWPMQSTVSTMCGRRSKPQLCGIPGITKQDLIVHRDGWAIWGWCSACVMETFPLLLPPVLTPAITSPGIIELHRKAREEIGPQWRGLRLTNNGVSSI